MNIILGSQSPRRRELLNGLDIPQTWAEGSPQACVVGCQVSIDADESYPADLKGGDIPKYIARAKADAYTRTHALGANDLLITSDTIVWLDGQVLGKPHSEDEAKAMLRSLSGRTHQVFTAVTFAHRSSSEDAAITFTTEVDRTDVTFDPLTDADIDYYVTNYKPFDKAGAYGIQEWIGYIAACRINGSYFTVMGFPTHLVHRYLKRFETCPASDRSKR